MIHRLPRDYDPHALKRMPDEPPHDLEPQVRGRWVLPESTLDWLQRLGRPKPASEAKPIRRAYLRSQADYYAYLNQGGSEHWGWQGLAGLFDLKLDPNRYGLYNRAQELYPQAFKSINTEFWRAMSDEERQEQMRKQAAAQERVGFVRNTEKFFIGDVQVAGLLGPGEEPSATELLTVFDTDYTLRRKAFQQRMKENEEIRLGKRKRRSTFATRDDADCQVLGLPSVVEGIANTPALKSMLPGAKLLSAQLAKEIAQRTSLDKPAPDSYGLRRLRGGKKRPTSYRDLPDKPRRASSENMVPAGSAQPRGISQAPSETGKRPVNRGRKFQRQALRIETQNKYGLKSRSELSYPQAFAPVATEMWTGLTEDERLRVYVTQAIAQEKTGFERGAPKFFIQDFDPAKERAPNLREEIGAAPAAALYSPASATNWTGGIIVAVSAIALLCCWQLDWLSWGVTIALICTALVGGIMLGLRGELKQ